MAEPPGSRETLTETAGYMPAKVRIENLIQAGIRLDNYRKEAYDFTADSTDADEEAFSAPERSYGFDPSDASIIEASIKKRLASRSEERARSKVAKPEPVTLATPPEAPKQENG